MLHQLIDPILMWIKDSVAQGGYLAVVIMMAIESANIPLPSEAIMPTAGILVQQGKMNFHLAALAGAIGCVIGSIPSYLLGMYGGRPFLAKYGRYLLLKEKELELAEKWVDRWGDMTFFVCRMLPVVRTFISFPAGVLKAHFLMFNIFTFIGSLIWCYFLTWVGVYFGENMETFRSIWHKFDLVIVIICVGGFGYYLYRHLKH
ncbi:MAG TPA: DedA family protein [Candidatus Obscuribacter sp.]|nr:DedA family protein [Candidatus Obscuribacter sp.]MBK9278002.1 DedA family protein [Candidatus Obscuribacter sp.]MBL8083183.1 DedA family protein [Candidatus Obscuribacter sp.]HMW91883.1 DedA family protein [Candidatus Obscuribacter sp.]HMY02621.1 DedA family protein [Candidatus Obscuribacter sp.]